MKGNEEGDRAETVRGRVGQVMAQLVGRARAERRASQERKRAGMLISIENALFGYRMPAAPTLIAAAEWRRDSIDAYCWRCGGSRAPFELPADGCGECRGRRFRYEGIVRLGRYAPPLSQWVPAIKHRAWRSMAIELGRELARQIADAVSAGAMQAPEIVIPVPTHWTRKLSRGIDHVGVLSEELAKRLGVPYGQLLRARLSLHQTGADRQFRRANRGRYTLSREARMAEGRRILLVDDVRTTGSTLRQAAVALAAAEPASIAAAVCAAVDSPRRNAMGAALRSGGADSTP